MTLIEQLHAEMFDDVTEMMNNPCGVYVFCNGEEIIYVGTSTMVYERIQSHFRRLKAGKGFEFTHVYLRICDGGGSARRLEIEMIRKFKPKYNVSDNIMPRSSALVEVPNVIIARRN